MRCGLVVEAKWALAEDAGMSARPAAPNASPAAAPADAPAWVPRVVQFMEEAIPFNAFLGVKVDHLAAGVCVLRLPWRAELVGDPFRPAVHGGVSATLIDTAGGAACFSLLERPTDRVSTVDMRVDYLRPGAGADLFCRGRVIRMGNRVAVTHMELFCGGLDTAEGPIATGSGVYNVLRKGDRS
jgi:uncharacterized protein (TIGR00369 family)